MADPIVVKVSELTELTDLAAGDLLTVVDVSETITSEKTKKLQATNLKIFVSAQITDLVVTAAKLAANAVETAKIKDLNVTTGKLADNSVTDAKLRDSAALSVIGNGTNASANPADIAAGTDGHVLRRSGTTLGFGQITSVGIADNAITESKLGTIKRTIVIRVGGSLDYVVVENYGKFFPVPVTLNGFEIVDARLNVTTASNSGSVVVELKVAGGLMSTLTLPVNQTGMSASGTINPSYKTFYTNNFLEVNVTSAGNAAKGLSITLVLEGNPA